MKNLASALLLAGALGLPALATAAEVHQAYLISPQDGATVNNPVKIVFGLQKDWGVAPAGVQKEKTGHFHLVIDAELPDLTKPIPANEHFLHLGGGQTETEIMLPAGKHTLQILLGDHNHVPHKPPVTSERITVVVAQDPSAPAKPTAVTPAGHNHDAHDHGAHPAPAAPPAAHQHEE